MKPTTWSLGGVHCRWQDYKNEDYDGLIVLACIERDMIPQNIKECNKRAVQMNKQTIAINQQNYALDLEQALIQYYTLIKPDERMRDQSFDIGNLSNEIYKGGIVYVAYRLEPEPSYSVSMCFPGFEYRFCKIFTNPVVQLDNAYFKIKQ